VKASSTQSVALQQGDVILIIPADSDADLQLAHNIPAIDQTGGVPSGPDGAGIIMALTFKELLDTDGISFLEAGG
jgi:hypothetical protein